VLVYRKLNEPVLSNRAVRRVELHLQPLTVLQPVLALAQGERR
jgi:hypothetical protein